MDQINKKAAFQFQYVLPVVAIIISVISIAISIWTTRELKHQWRETVIGRISLVDAGYFYWKSYSQKEASLVNFGYPVSLRMQSSADRRFSDEQLLPTRLVAYDVSTKQRLPGVMGLTVNEINENLRLRNFSPQQVYLRKHYKIQLQFKKFGNTIAKNFTITVDTKISDSEDWIIGEPAAPSDLMPDMSVFKNLDFYTSLESPLPNNIKFKIHYKYTDAEGNHVEEDVSHVFDD